MFMVPKRRKQWTAPLLYLLSQAQVKIECFLYFKWCIIGEMYRDILFFASI
jgi:hypothetical protein